MKTKTKLTIAVASVLSVAALAGTGYAGWVISQNAVDKANGNVLVYNVKNNAVDMTKPAFVDKGSIIWGKDSNAEITDTSWFSWTDDSKTNTREEQFFTPSVTFEISNKDTNDFKQPIVEAALTVTDDDSKYETCRATKNLIHGPKAGEAQKFDAQNPATGLKMTITQKADKQNTFDVTLSVGSDIFGWGSHFAVDGVNKNPAYFYNAHKATDKIDGTEKTYFDDANESMTAIYGLIDVTFEINITVSHAK